MRWLVHGAGMKVFVMKWGIMRVRKDAVVAIFKIPKTAVDNVELEVKFIFHQWMSGKSVFSLNASVRVNSIKYCCIGEGEFGGEMVESASPTLGTDGTDCGRVSKL